MHSGRKDHLAGPSLICEVRLLCPLGYCSSESYLTLIPVAVDGGLRIPAASPWFIGFITGAMAGGYVWFGPRGTCCWIGSMFLAGSLGQIALSYSLACGVFAGILIGGRYWGGPGSALRAHHSPAKPRDDGGGDAGHVPSSHARKTSKIQSGRRQAGNRSGGPAADSFPTRTAGTII